MNSYRVAINGKNYDLPPRTLNVDEHIEEITKKAEQYEKGEIPRIEMVQVQHDFVSWLTPESIPAIDDVDTNELLRICVDIINVYNAPALEAKADAEASKIRRILEKPEIKKAINLASTLNK